MPAQASPDGLTHYAGATPNYMTPRTPKTPDEHGSLANMKKAGFHRQQKTREESLMERVRQHRAKQKKGNAFDQPPLPDGTNLQESL
jgi:hypothetical protein